MIVVLLPDSTNGDDQVQPADLQPADILFPDINSFMTYDEVDKHTGLNPVAYITAEFADNLFPADNMFVVGGDDQPNDHADRYSNGPLSYGSSYAFFLRTYPLTDSVSPQFFFFLKLCFIVE